jgi:hypothetical protein
MTGSATGSMRIAVDTASPVPLSTREHWLAAMG